jgi:hypothetical protein
MRLLRLQEIVHQSGNKSSAEENRTRCNLSVLQDEGPGFRSKTTTIECGRKGLRIVTAWYKELGNMLSLEEILR